MGEERHPPDVPGAEPGITPGSTPVGPPAGGDEVDSGVTSDEEAQTPREREQIEDPGRAS